MHILNMTRKKVTVVGLSVLAAFSSFKQNRKEQSFFVAALVAAAVGTTDASFTKSFFKLELKIFQDPEGRNGSLVIIGKGKIHVITDSSSFESLMVLIQMIQTRERKRECEKEREKKKRGCVPT